MVSVCLRACVCVCACVYKRLCVTATALPVTLLFHAFSIFSLVFIIFPPSYISHSHRVSFEFHFFKHIPFNIIILNIRVDIHLRNFDPLRSQAIRRLVSILKLAESMVFGANLVVFTHFYARELGLHRRHSSPGYSIHQLLIEWDLTNGQVLNAAVPWVCADRNAESVALIQETIHKIHPCMTESSLVGGPLGALTSDMFMLFCGFLWMFSGFLSDCSILFYVSCSGSPL